MSVKETTGTLTVKGMGQIAVFLRVLAAPGLEPWTVQTSDVYYAILRDLPEPMILRGVLKGMGVWKFRPSPAEVLQAVCDEIGCSETGEAPAQFLARKESESRWSAALRHELAAPRAPALPRMPDAVRERLLSRGELGRIVLEAGQQRDSTPVEPEE